jgi:hypothetical protein
MPAGSTASASVAVPSNWRDQSSNLAGFPRFTAWNLLLKQSRLRIGIITEAEARESRMTGMEIPLDGTSHLEYLEYLGIRATAFNKVSGDKCAPVLLSNIFWIFTQE